MDTHITIPKARLVELETAEYKRKVLEAALLQAQNAAIQLAHRDTQRQAEYEDMQQTMHNMARNHALQLEAARKHEPESVPELRAQLQTLGLWIAEALPTLDTVEPECSTEAELLTALIRRGEMLVLASLARGGALGPNKKLSGCEAVRSNDS